MAKETSIEINGKGWKAKIPSAMICTAFTILAGTGVYIVQDGVGTRAATADAAIISKQEFDAHCNDQREVLDKLQGQDQMLQDAAGELRTDQRVTAAQFRDIERRLSTIEQAQQTTNSKLDQLIGRFPVRNPGP